MVNTPVIPVLKEDEAGGSQVKPAWATYETLSQKLKRKKFSREKCVAYLVINIRKLEIRLYFGICMYVLGLRLKLYTCRVSMPRFGFVTTGGWQLLP